MTLGGLDQPLPAGLFTAEPCPAFVGLPADLPDPALRARWLPAPQLSPQARRIAEEELARCSGAPGWNPKVRKLIGSLHMIDICARHDGELHSVKVANVADHPFLARLPRTAPRAVRTIYRADTRLAMARATDALHVISIMLRAQEAWDKWRAVHEVA